MMGLAFHVSFALILVFLATGCVRTLPIHGCQCRVIPGSVATMEPATIGGIPPKPLVSRRSRCDPALILLHGGPRTIESALFRHYNSALEHHFLVVYWEQRGTGCSFNPAISPQTMTIAQFVRDLDEVVKLVRRRFDKDKAVLPCPLLGHGPGDDLCRPLPGEGFGLRRYRAGCERPAGPQVIL